MHDADIGIMSVTEYTTDIPRSDTYVSAIARLHAGHEAEQSLAASLNGRTIAVRGCTIDEWVELKPLLDSCGARPVRVLVPDVFALVIGSRIMPADITAATERGLALLRRHDIAVIATVCTRVRDRNERATREAVDRALVHARRASLAHEARRVDEEEMALRRGLHVQLRDR